MSTEQDNSTAPSVPTFAATAGVTGYKFAKEAYLDLLFMRPVFSVDHALQEVHESGLVNAKAKMTMKTVSSVTLTENQARELIRSIEDQLEKLKEI